MNQPSSDFFQELRVLLERRLAVIGDRDLRDRDPAQQLDQLRAVSEQITAEHEKHKAELPPRLKHYLERASYSKALAWLNGEES